MLAFSVCWWRPTIAISRATLRPLRPPIVAARVSKERFLGEWNLPNEHESCARETFSKLRRHGNHGLAARYQDEMALFADVPLFGGGMNDA